MYLLQPLPIAVLLLALLYAYLDWETREVPLWLLAVTAVIGVAYCISRGRQPGSIAQALIPGIMMFLLSVLSDGALGTGDSVYICVMALFMSWQQVCLLLCAAFLLAGTAALAITVRAVIRGRRIKQMTLPLLCFMPAGVILAFYLTLQ